MMTSFWLSYTTIIGYKLKLKRFAIVGHNLWGEMIKVHIGHWGLAQCCGTVVPPYDICVSCFMSILLKNVLTSWTNPHLPYCWMATNLDSNFVALSPFY